MSPDVAVHQARRAYELGRLRFAALRAGVLAAVVAVVGFLSLGRDALPWTAVTLAVWWFAIWYGRGVQRGAVFGLVGGLVTMALPMSLLRPCCAAGAAMGPDCCTMPGACGLAGIVVGVIVAGAAPVGRTGFFSTSAGLVLGMASVAALKCSGLFLGEGLGLALGLAVGLAGVSAAKAWLRPARATS